MSGMSLQMRNRSRMACEPVVLVAVDRGGDADGRPVLLADQLVHEQHGVAAVRMGGELGPELVDRLDHGRFLSASYRH